MGETCECVPGFVGVGCESKELVPLPCGTTCQHNCLNIPLGDDSVEHCEQVAPMDILPNGTYPATTIVTALDAQQDPKQSFPGFKCYQMCYTKCVQGCFDQLHPFRSKTVE